MDKATEGANVIFPFPPELTETVIKCFDPITDRSTLCACASASHSLRTPSRKRVFSYIRIGPKARSWEPEDTARARCRAFYDLLADSPDIASFVIECRIDDVGLEMGRYSEGWVWEDSVLPKILGQLTHLRSLSLAEHRPVYTDLSWWRVSEPVKQAFRRAFQRLTRLEVWVYWLSPDDFPSLFGNATSLKQLVINCEGPFYCNTTAGPHCTVPQLDYLKVRYGMESGDDSNSGISLDHHLFNVHTILDLRSLKTLSLDVHPMDTWNLSLFSSFACLEELVVRVMTERVRDMSEYQSLPVFNQLYSVTVIVDDDIEDDSGVRLRTSLFVLSQILHCLPCDSSGNLHEIVVQIHGLEIDNLQLDYLLKSDWTNITLFFSDASLKKRMNKMERFAIEGIASSLLSDDLPDVFDFVEKKLQAIYERGIFQLALIDCVYGKPDVRALFGHDGSLGHHSAITRPSFGMKGPQTPSDRANLRMRVSDTCRGCADCYVTYS